VPTLFLDRDGVLIKDVGYPTTPADVEWIPGVFEALRLVKSVGYRIIVVTNQSAVARGYATFQELVETQAYISDRFEAEGCGFDAVYVAPTHPDGTVWPFNRYSPWRKPGSGMIQQAIVDFDIDPATAALIGDSARDLEAGHACDVAYLIGFGDRDFGTARVDLKASNWANISRILTTKEW
jgi:D-glycero-D-manno-heptose 1,7-bisphosphate phosphatase